MLGNDDEDPRGEIILNFLFYLFDIIFNFGKIKKLHRFFVMIYLKDTHSIDYIVTRF